jgi:hypothetical protein
VPFGHYEATCAECRRRAQGGADILRIGDLIEHEQDAIGFDLVERHRGKWLDLEHNALMHGVRAEEPVEIFGARLFRRHAPFGEERS